jgi:GT2 family glycosyltransferase
LLVARDENQHLPATGDQQLATVFPMPLVSFLISTYNRRDELLRTLEVLHGSAAGANPSEIIVVDNASQDSTADAVQQKFPKVRVIRQSVNRGPCAKNLGLPVARGQYVVFLDDDSFPHPQSIDRMVDYFRADPQLGAAAFDVVLTNGAHECSAYSDVFTGCGVGLRADALAQVGGLPEDFFMAAEEYDLALRLLDAGWKIKRFDDLCVTHLKTPQSRFPSRIMRLDVRNNLTLIGRYFPDQWFRPFAMDWAKRYRMIAKVNGSMQAYYTGLATGLIRLFRRPDRRPMRAAAFETFAKIERIQNLMNSMPKKILLIDLGKNIYPYWLAAKRNGLEIVAIADAKLGGHGFKYRGIPVLDDSTAEKLAFDAAVVSNLSPIHAALRCGIWKSKTDRPVFDLLQESRISERHAPVLSSAA